MLEEDGEEETSFSALKADLESFFLVNLRFTL
jgi:hypothetical protein